METKEASAFIRGFIIEMRTALNWMTDDLCLIQAPDFPAFDELDCGECKQCHTNPRVLFRRSGHGVLRRCATCFIDFEQYLDQRYSGRAVWRQA